MKVASTAVGLALSALLAALSAAASAADQGTVYLWTDKDGTPHYQDRPPEGSDNEDAQELSLRYKMTDNQAVAEANKQQTQASDIAKVREDQKAEDKASDAEDRQKVVSEREQGCNQAKERMQKYETAHRLYKPGPDGQRQYLSDEEIDAARAAARKDVDEWCSE